MSTSTRTPAQMPRLFTTSFTSRTPPLVRVPCLQILLTSAADWLKQAELGAMPELKYIGLYNERSGSTIAGANIKRQGWATVNDSPVWMFSVGERLYWATRQVPASIISTPTFPDATATSTYGLKYIAPAKCKVSRTAPYALFASSLSSSL